MKNRILSITRETIPYVKQIRPLTGSVAATILMQQLDYWFAKYPDGFYKFLEPCDHPSYKSGDSWTEELGFSKDEFRTAFKQIGIQHKSKTKFATSSDPFQGKFYCSYFDRTKGQVFYHRNHELVDKELDAIEHGIPVESRKSAIPISRNRQGQFTEIGNPDIDIYTETTSRDYFINQGINQAHKAVPGTADRDAEFDQTDLPQEEIPITATGKTGSDSSTPQPQPKADRSSGLGDSIKDQGNAAFSPKKEKTSKAGKRKVAFKYDAYGVIQMPEAKRYKLPSILTMRTMQFLLAKELECEFGIDRDGDVWVSDPKMGDWMLEEEAFGGGSDGEQGQLPLKKMVSILNSERAAFPLDIDWYNDTAKRYFEFWRSNCDRLGKDALPTIQRYGSIAHWLIKLQDEAFDIEFESIDLEEVA
jgi:hypothetical protein